MIALIPARGGSKRIPRKNLVGLCGKPLMVWTLEAAIRADVGPVFVSTDDEEIAEVAHRHFAYVHLRDTWAATSEATADDVVSDFRSSGFSGQDCSEGLLYLQPTSPLRTSGHIREFVHGLRGLEDLPALSAAPNYRRAFRTNESGHDEGVGWMDCGAMYYMPHDLSFLAADANGRWHTWCDTEDAAWAIDVDWPWDLAAAEHAMKDKGWV